MSKQNLIFLLAILITAVGCKRNVAPQNNASYIKVEQVYGILDTLEGELYKERLPSNYTPLRLYKTAYGFLGTGKYNDMGIHLADTLTGKFMVSGCPMITDRIEDDKAVIITRTDGPLNSVAHSDYNPLTETLFVADVYSNSISSFKVQNDSIVQTNRYHMPFTNAYMVDFKTINDSTFVLLMLHPNAHKLYKVDAVKGIITDSLDYHIYENSDIDHSKIKVLSLDMCITPDRKNIIINDRVYNVLKSYKISENGFELEKEWMYFEPSMAIKDGVPQLNDDHLKGEGNVFATNEYIYMLSACETVRDHKELTEYVFGSYRGENELLVKYILVFKRDDLSFVTSFVMDNRIDWINVMPDNKTVYASVNLHKTIITLKDAKHKRNIAKYILPDFSRTTAIHTLDLKGEKPYYKEEKQHPASKYYTSYKELISKEPAKILTRAFTRDDSIDNYAGYFQDNVLYIGPGRPVPTGYSIADSYARQFIRIGK